MPLAPPPPPPASRAASRPASHAFLPTWQDASAFNQPLSFDTSSVTDMTGMFAVRSTRALAPSLQLYFSWAFPVHAACAAATSRNPRLPAHTSSRIACPPSDLAGRVGVQPAPELRHLQPHEHVPDVLRALRACSGSSLQLNLSWALPMDAAHAAAAPRHPRLPAHTSSRIACPPSDSAGLVGVQPATEL